LQPATVEAADALGWSADAIEAQAFGFLAARGLKGLPLSYPATTGVSFPMTGGIVARPDSVAPRLSQRGRPMRQFIAS